VLFAGAALRNLPLMLMTECGAVRTSLSQEALPSASFTVSDDGGLGRRNWHGAMTRSEPDDFFSALERPQKAWHGQERTAGLDIISRSGSVIAKRDN
jgi:hypothetical protein